MQGRALTFLQLNGILADLLLVSLNGPLGGDDVCVVLVQHGGVGGGLAELRLVVQDLVLQRVQPRRQLVLLVLVDLKG